MILHLISIRHQTALTTPDSETTPPQTRRRRERERERERERRSRKEIIRNPMKSGKKKTETAVEEGDGVEERSGDAGGEEEKGGGEEGERLGKEEERGEVPRLEEGFYEIEGIRKKRVRKGQIQYLIKW